MRLQERLERTNPERYCLDTNIISEILRRNFVVLSRFKKVLKDGLICGLPSMAYFEVVRGLLANLGYCKLNEIESMRKNVLMDMPMNYDVLYKASEIYASLKQNGQLIEDADILIAATAICYECVLVTDNVKHFSRIPGLRIENWTRKDNKENVE